MTNENNLVIGDKLRDEDIVVISSRIVTQKKQCHSKKNASLKKKIYLL